MHRPAEQSAYGRGPSDAAGAPIGDQRQWGQPAAAGYPPRVPYQPGPAQNYPAGPWGQQPGMAPGGPVPPVGLPPSPYYHETRPGNGFGIAALVLGILSIVSMFGGLLLGPLAVIFGFVQRARARQAQVPTSGMAVAGIVTGFVGIGIALVLFLAVVIPVMHSEQLRGNDNAAKSDVRNMETAQEDYFTDHGTYLAGSDAELAGMLRWTKSSSVKSVTVTAPPGSTIYQAYVIVAVSQTGHSFCYNTTNSGAGVVSGSYC